MLDGQQTCPWDNDYNSLLHPCTQVLQHASLITPNYSLESLRTPTLTFPELLLETWTHLICNSRNGTAVCIPRYSAAQFSDAGSITQCCCLSSVVQLEVAPLGEPCCWSEQ
jgi:hypothetical protein